MEDCALIGDALELVTIGTPLLWAGFIAFVLLMLALDLLVFHRKPGEVSLKDAGIWSGVWVSLALAFAGLLAWRHGGAVGTDFLTGYVIEKSLSVDNIFVFVVLFAAYQTPKEHQHRILFWGILGALVMRAGMIWGGVALLEHFHWLVYGFAVFLVWTGVRLLLAWRKGDSETQPTENAILKRLERIIPSTPQLRGGRFFVREGGRLLATPLLITLLMVEGSDAIFALDSIPAIFVVTEDPFVVFTSNIFAVLGLRSLFFLLAGMVDRFRYLKLGLAAVLVFVGVKMGINHVFPVPTWASLGIILGLLSASILFSLRSAPAKQPAQ